MFFFFQAEDGIRDVAVTGVQTCALPISQLVARMPGWLTAIVRDTEINLATYPGYSFETTPSLLAEFGASTFVSTTCRSRRCTAPPPMNADDGGDLPAPAGGAPPPGDAAERP